MSRGGVPGNSGGKPGRSGRKPRAVEQNLQELLAQAADDAERVELLRAIFEKAKGGDMRAARLFLEMAYGKPKTTAEISAGPGAAIKFIVGVDESDL